VQVLYGKPQIKLPQLGDPAAFAGFSNICANFLQFYTYIFYQYYQHTITAMDNQLLESIITLSEQAHLSFRPLLNLLPEIIRQSTLFLHWNDSYFFPPWRAASRRSTLLVRDWFSFFIASSSDITRFSFSFRPAVVSLASWNYEKKTMRYIKHRQMLDPIS